MADLIPFISNTNTIKLLVRDQITDGSVSDATITFNIKDTAGTEMTSGSLTYDSVKRLRNRNYALFLGTIAHTVALVENTLYYLNVTMTHDSKQGLWENVRVKPRKREMRA